MAFNMKQFRRVACENFKMKIYRAAQPVICNKKAQEIIIRKIFVEAENRFFEIIFAARKA